MSASRRRRRERVRRLRHQVAVQELEIAALWEALRAQNQINKMQTQLYNDLRTRVEDLEQRGPWPEWPQAHIPNGVHETN